MLDQFLESRDTVRRLRSGVLGAHLDSFAEHLARCGYAAATARSQLTLLGHFDQWMARRRRGLGALNDELVRKFVHDRTRLGKLQRGESAAVRQFLTHLRVHGVIPSPAPVIDETALGRLQRQYEQYLVLERGLAPATVTNYCGYFRGFLSERFGKGPMNLRALDVSTVTTFVVRHAPTMSPGRAKLMATALRSIFQFLLQRGAIERDLAGCVPRMSDWRLATIPKYLSPDEVERLLQACDCQTSVGRRDQAILLLLARLGLRAGEIVALELDDIYWRAGEMTVRSSKRLPQDRLPLPREVGEALATYIRRDRPTQPTRRVFLCTKAPRRGFTGPGTVSTIVRRALARAGLCPALKGAHLLRHSLATRMLRHGASLPEIGQVLRHRGVTTTEIYAKVDLAGLRALAQPWPLGGGAL
jgi:site-specific recombinase XerD